MATVHLQNLRGLGAEARRLLHRAGVGAIAGERVGTRRFVEIERTQNKWRNIKTEVDGIRFDSAREAERYGELRLQAQTGLITELQVHTRFSLDVDGTYVGDYIADFVYRKDAALVVEDVKSRPTRTPVYRLKKKLMRAIHGIEIQEIF